MPTHALLNLLLVAVTLGQTVLSKVTPYTTIATTTLSPGNSLNQLYLTNSAGNASTAELTVTGTPVYIVVSGSTTVAVPTRNELPSATSKAGAAGAHGPGQTWSGGVLGILVLGQMLL